VKRAREVIGTGEVATGILRVERSDATILSIARELRAVGGRLIIVVDDIHAIRHLACHRLEADAYLSAPLTKQAVLERVNAVLAPSEWCERVPKPVETLPSAT